MSVPPDVMDWRTLAGGISRQHGAWLIDVPDPLQDSDPEEAFAAARRRRTAMRVAERLAYQWGWRGPWRWTDHGLTSRRLHGAPPPDDPDDEEDEDG